MPHDSDDGIPIRIRTKRNPFPVLPVVAAGIGGAVLIVGGAIAVLMTGGGSAGGAGGGVNLPATFGGQPAAEKEGKDWTTQQLGEYLKSRGVIESWEQIPQGDSPPRDIDTVPAMYVRLKGGHTAKVFQYGGEIGCEAVAKRLTSPGNMPYGFVSWGRFLIHSNQHDGTDVERTIYPVLRGSKYWSMSEQGVPCDVAIGRVTR